jgi:NAD(P)-dependent dehydrogenase (short-subunit alcohol dehydrogenase family)
MEQLCSSIFLQLSLLLECLYFTLFPLLSKALFFTPVTSAEAKPTNGIFVTAGSSELGQELVVALAQQGFTVFAGVARHEDGVKLFAKAQKEIHTRIVLILLNFSSIESVRSAVQLIEQSCEDSKTSLVALIVICVSGGAVTLEMITDSLCREVFDENFSGPVLLVKLLRQRLTKARGRIICLTGLFGTVHSPKSTLYTSSMMALTGFFNSIRLELSEVEIILITHGTVPCSKVRLFGLTHRSLGVIRIACNRRHSHTKSSHDDFYPRKEFFGGKICQFLCSNINDVCRGIIYGILTEYPMSHYYLGTDCAILSLLSCFLPTPFLDRFGEYFLNNKRM